MVWRKMLWVGAVVAAMLSVTGCLESSGMSVVDPAEMVTLEKAHITQEGDSLVVRGFAAGVESSVRPSQVTVGGKSFAAEDDTSNIVQCYICVCSPEQCVCVKTDC